MGMTYWIQTREGDRVTSESEDHTLMHELSESLDEICRNLGIPELSSFADFTDLELHLMDDGENMEDDWDEDAFDDNFQIDKLKDKMDWFDPAAGLHCLETLRLHVQEGWNDELELDEREMLLDELDSCIEKLKALPPEGAQFNLAVIM